ncbi:MAG: hypothetical protein WCN81_08915, partial [Actinomycetes bacterium]
IISDTAPTAPPKQDELPTVDPLGALRQLMDGDNVTELDVRRAVHAEGYMPLDTPIENYPADFVEGKLIAHWPAVLEVIEEVKATTH